MEKITIHSPEAKSPDFVAENIARLKDLFPELLTESKDGTAVNLDVLKTLVGDKTAPDAEEKYGLNWHGKRKARQLALTPSTGTLRPCPDQSVDWDTTQNLMIEGDNLEVLKLLQKSYAGKVKLIYIDPPYNTGTDRIYPDNFEDGIKNYQMLTGQIDSDGRKLSSNPEVSGRFHTTWLNMIYPRLKLARNLLSKDGVLLISIDDHEVDNLRRICSEVLGEENFVASMVWEKGRKNDAKLISAGHEYVLVYARSLGLLRERKTIWREEKPGAREIWDKYLELRAAHKADDRAIEADLHAWFSELPRTHPSKKWSRYKHIDRHGPWRDDNISWPGGGGPTYDLKHPKTGLPCKVPERGWVYAELATMESRIRAGIVEFREDHTEPPIRKSHLRPIAFDEVEEEAFNQEILADDEDELATQVRGTYFYKQAQVTSKAMRSLMGEQVFSNPKDHEEIARLLDYFTGGDPSTIVLDFFAGSGTTGHSVFVANAKDGGQRRFILVQLPEPLDPSDKDQKNAWRFCARIKRPANIAELTKERLRRAGKRVCEENPSLSADVGFRVFKLDSSNINSWEPDRADLPKTLEESVEHLKTDRTESDILFELLLKLGLDLCVPIEKRSIASKDVHSIGGGVLFTCLAEAITASDIEPLAQGIIAWHVELAPAGDTTCVFRDSAFADDVAKTNLTAILQQHNLANVRSL
jgi:adenine-specific DNA-methyltransferase